jgi:starch synthase
MRVVHLAAEFAPYAKAGGLGEVVSGLSRELARTHLDLEVIVPKYDHVEFPSIKLELGDYKSLSTPCAAWSSPFPHAKLTCIEPRAPFAPFHRGALYGFADDAARFLSFTRAAIDYLRLQKKEIDILHLHDWHVAAAAPLIRLVLKDLSVKKIILTLHNLEYQGRCAPYELEAIGLPPLFPDPKYPEAQNILKAGLLYADQITTVSPSYAQEILTPAFGHGLSSILKKRGVTGILNGLDLSLWDPASDPHLPTHFSPSSTLSQLSEAKASAKRELAKRYGLDPLRRPWIGSITRIVPQKGPELLEQTLHYCREHKATFALLGSSPFLDLQSHFARLKQAHPEALIELSYSEPLAHLLYAALDYLIAPSHFEPCGLTQMIAMRYGTVPIVRATGGLKDTVFDLDNPKIVAAERNGFTFEDPLTLSSTLARASHLFHRDQASLFSLIRRGLGTDVSWKNPAKQYLKLYTNPIVD